MAAWLEKVTTRALLVWVLVTALGPLEAAGFAAQGGSGSSASRQDALKAIPLDKLSEVNRQKVLSVVQDTSFFRRLPICIIRCDPELYLFVVRHPDVIVAIWQAMGITEIQLEEISPGKFRYRDSEGTRGVVEYIYSTHDTELIYAETVYEGPLLNRTVHSRAVILLKSGYTLETDGHYYITCRLDAFVSVDKAAWEVLTKTLHPLVGRIADTNFAQTAQFVAMLHETAAQKPDGMQRLAARLKGVQPPVREEFARLLAQVAERSSSTRQGPRETVAERPGPQVRK
ncbi:MAG: hypothetical protein NZ899_03220 [Thermoguttaceae bacterium]|nr:hypothetical protein [Thermoguttaceae bacterium]MDW8078874.1 hypothetical protein [Thermoguttaceae bacterium]